MSSAMAGTREIGAVLNCILPRYLRAREERSSVGKWGGDEVVVGVKAYANGVPSCIVFCQGGFARERWG